MVHDINLDSLQLSQTKSGSLTEKTSKQSDFVDRKQSKRNGESNLTCQERKKKEKKMEFDFCERKTWKIKRMDGKENNRIFFF